MTDFLSDNKIVSLVFMLVVLVSGVGLFFSAHNEANVGVFNNNDGVLLTGMQTEDAGSIEGAVCSSSSLPSAVSAKKRACDTINRQNMCNQRGLADCVINACCSSTLTQLKLPLGLSGPQHQKTSSKVSVTNLQLGQAKLPALQLPALQTPPQLGQVRLAVLKTPPKHCICSGRKTKSYSCPDPEKPRWAIAVGCLSSVDKEDIGICGDCVAMCQTAVEATSETGCPSYKNCEYMGSSAVVTSADCV